MSGHGSIRTSAFRPPWWLSNRHLQTILPNSPLRPRARLDLRGEVLELPDGDFLRLEWLDGDGPTILVLHGLEGSSRSRYACGIMNALGRAGYRLALMTFRGCGGIPNRLARSYHAGDTTDVAFVIDQIRERHGDQPIGALGYSLGGNALLKHLGERGSDTPLHTAIAVSVPFDLQESCAAMSIGGARFYQDRLLGRLKKSTRRKFTEQSAPCDLSAGLCASDFEGFDGNITAPLHGFADAADYYRKSSSRPYLRGIRVPTLILHACDDPFMTRAAIPAVAELSASTTLELSERGGHVGFVAGTTPWTLSCWLDERIAAHFGEVMRAPEATVVSQPRRNRIRSWRRRARPENAGRPATSGAGEERERSSG